MCIAPSLHRARAPGPLSSLAGSNYDNQHPYRTPGWIVPLSPSLLISTCRSPLTSLAVARHSFTRKATGQRKAILPSRTNGGHYDFNRSLDLRTSNSGQQPSSSFLALCRLPSRPPARPKPSCSIVQRRRRQAFCHLELDTIDTISTIRPSLHHRLPQSSNTLKLGDLSGTSISTDPSWT